MEFKIDSPTAGQGVKIHGHRIEQKQVAQVGISPTVHDRALADENRLDALCPTLERQTLERGAYSGRSDENTGFIQDEGEGGPWLTV